MFYWALFPLESHVNMIFCHERTFIIVLTNPVFFIKSPYFNYPMSYFAAQSNNIQVLIHLNSTTWCFVSQYSTTIRYYADRGVTHTRHYAVLIIPLYGIMRLEVRCIYGIMRFL